MQREIEQLEELKKIILSPLKKNLIDIAQRCEQIEAKATANSRYSQMLNKVNRVANQFDNQLLPPFRAIL